MLLLFLDARQGSARVPGGPAVFPKVASDEGTPHICEEVQVWDTRGQEPSRPECPDHRIKIPGRPVSSCRRSSGPQSSRVHRQEPGGVLSQQGPGLQAEGDPPRDEREGRFQG